MLEYKHDADNTLLPARPSKKLILGIINTVLMVLLIGIITINQITISAAASAMQVDGVFGRSKTSNPKLSGDAMADATKIVISSGFPDIYGAELRVSFDAVQPSLDVLKAYDPTYGSSKIALAGAALQRYIDVGMKIACEYCCGAKALITTNGQAACGCAHSQAMRGLLAYLIIRHGDQYTNDQLLQEMARWKGMFFPKQMITKLTGQMQGSAPFTTDTAALVMGMSLPQYGKNSAQAPVPSQINNLPNMVGGC